MVPVSFLGTISSPLSKHGSMKDCKCTAWPRRIVPSGGPKDCSLFLKMVTMTLGLLQNKTIDSFSFFPISLCSRFINFCTSKILKNNDEVYILSLSSILLAVRSDFRKKIFP